MRTPSGADAQNGVLLGERPDAFPLLRCELLDGLARRADRDALQPQNFPFKGDKVVFQELGDYPVRGPPACFAPLPSGPHGTPEAAR